MEDTSVVDAVPRSKPDIVEGDTTIPSPSAVRGAKAESKAVVGDWPDPAPLPVDLPPVEPFHPELLPEALRRWVLDIADRMQCPVDFPAVATVTALATVVGRQICIMPKRHDTWTVVPNLWGLIIAGPGEFKTPAMQEALRPLNILETRVRQLHQESMQSWQAAEIVAREASKVLGQKLRQALRNDGDAVAIAKQFLEGANGEPARRRHICNDSTVEKLGEILRDNPRGILIFRDEFSGFLRSMEKEGHQADRAFYLEAWNGTNRFTYDRIGRGTVEIEAACVSMLGSIQPGPLTAYLTEYALAGAGGDGLLQRFQLAVWPDRSISWTNVDREPDRFSLNAAFAVFERLDALDPGAVGAKTSDGEEIPYIRFSDQAQIVFDEYREELELRLRNDDEHPAFIAHLAKYRSLIPSLALLFHLVDEGTGSVGEAAVLRAIGWAQYLESHARRLYATVISPDMAAARTLGSRIQSGQLGTSFASRDVYRKQWAGLTHREAAEAGISVLLELDWLRERVLQTGGRSRKIFLVNPEVFGAPQ